ncbi:hypothetical protein PV325_010134 [Microctonus aethiopoides]|nr:hypothetical protein PV325_010134 [Microctonus aethiopoides]
MPIRRSSLDDTFSHNQTHSTFNNIGNKTWIETHKQYEPFKHKSRRINMSQDSGSESTALLSSESCASACPVMFYQSETSDMDSESSEGGTKYGSVTAASFTSTINVVPRRLPPLIQENKNILNNTNELSSPLLFKHKCYDLHSSIELHLLNCDGYQSSESPLVSAIKFTKIFQQVPQTVNLPDEALSILNTLPKQSSLVTIFSIWNTILGASLLTMPWGISMAGLIPGLILILTMSGLCLYTAYCILQVYQYHGGHMKIEVPELCRFYLGSFAEFIAQIFSIMVLLGANIAYWILMSNFLYNSVNFLYDKISGSGFHPSIENVTHLPEVICPRENIFNSSKILAERSFDNIGPAWDLYKTVPIFLGMIVFPLLNFNSTTFFTKFNSLGTAAIVYLLALVTYKSARWGVNMNEFSWDTSWRLKTTFPALCGMLALSFFIHNIIITIMQHNRHQRNNSRDLTIAFILVTLTYVAVGVTFYITFPLAKSCIEDNFLNNFQKSDVLTVGARIVLFFQLLTVYPLIAYMLRIRLLTLIFSKTTVSRLSVILVNLTAIIVCILFATFFPYIGTVIRYTGAISGLIYVFTIPSLLHLALMCKKGEINIVTVLLHVSIPVVGLANVVAQIFVVIKTDKGPVQGEILVTTRLNLKFSSFRGIRYGKPPIGRSRFMPPEEAEPWSEIFTANSEATPCPQIDAVDKINYIGNEDCLNLNVYTPKINFDNKEKTDLLAVMIWLYGGQYHHGYTNITYFGPDYLIENNVVIVAINFRLGALGYFALNLPNASGNAALKDQVLAFKWVKRNIKSFGGDPNKVTIFGESTGGASVDFHVLSHASSGLFHRSISMSASALCPWTMASISEMKSQAFHLGRMLGIYTNDTQILLTSMYDIPAEKIIRASSNISSNLRPFKPVIENPDIAGESAFLTECSIKKYISGKFNQLPHMTGFLASEALLLFTTLQTLKITAENVEQQSSLIMADIPANMMSKLTKITGGLPQNVVSNVIDEIIDKSIANVTEVLYASPIDSKIQLLRKYNPVYYYRISVTPDASLHKERGLKLIKGAAHGDDIAYLWHMSLYNFPTNPVDPFVITRDRMTRMWTNFAKYSNPTPLGKSDLLLNVTWPVSGIYGNHLEIDNTLFVSERPINSITKKIETAYFPYLQKFCV